MFQEPLTAVMTMLFLYFAGVLVMFIFVIRSLASQGEERREAFRKQQLMLGDLERHLIDMKVMLRRLMPDRAEMDEESLNRDSSMPLLKQEDPLEAMLEAAAVARKQDVSTLAARLQSPRPEVSLAGQGAKPSRSQQKQAVDDHAPSARPMQGLGKEEQELPDFFNDQQSQASESKPQDAHALPPHEGLRNTDAHAVPDKPATARAGEALAPGAAFPKAARKPVNFVSLDDQADDDQSLVVEKVEVSTRERLSMTVTDMADADDQSLQVFRLEKKTVSHERKSDPAGPVSPLAASQAAGMAGMESPPAWLKEMEKQEHAPDQAIDGHEESAAPAKKPRLRVPGPPSDLDIDLSTFSAPGSPAGSSRSRPEPFPQVEEKVVAGMGGALFSAQNGRPLHTRGADNTGIDEEGESLKRIYEEGLKVDETVNLFDIEAEKEEERKRDEAGQEGAAIPDLVAELRDNGHPEKAGDPLPEGFTVVPDPALGGGRYATEKGLSPELETPVRTFAGDATVDGAAQKSAPDQKPETPELSKGLGRYSLEVKPLLEPAQAEERSEELAPPALSDPLVADRGETAAEAGLDKLEKEAAPAAVEVSPGLTDKADREEDTEGEQEEEARQQSARSQAGKDSLPPLFRSPHPIDRKVMSGRKQPGKKGRHPTSL